jgi:hypothetical protein
MFDKVSCVVCIDTGFRTSQYYTRFGDAVRKEQQLNKYCTEIKYVAREFVVVTPEEWYENKNSSLQ